MFCIDNGAVVWKVLDGEAVVVHSDSAQYYGLNVAGTALWADLDGGADLDELTSRLNDRFDRPVDDARGEARSFVAALLEAELIVEDDSPAPVGAEFDEAHSTGPYEPPTLVRFGDLNALVLSGE